MKRLAVEANIMIPLTDADTTTTRLHFACWHAAGVSSSLKLVLQLLSGGGVGCCASDERLNGLREGYKGV